MNRAEIKSEATRLIGELEKRSRLGRLAPFGDGPVEALIAADLVTRVPESSIRERILAEAVAMVAAEVLSEDIPTAAARRLADLAFVARFSKIGLPTHIIAFVIERLVHSNTADGIEAAADLIRTAARRGGDACLIDDIDFDDFEVDFQLACAELLGRNHDRRAVGLLLSLPSSAELDQLLWTLAQCDAFVSLLGPDNEDEVQLERLIQSSLKRLHSGSDALSLFKERVIAARANFAQSFDAIDYRRTEMAAEESFA